MSTMLLAGLATSTVFFVRAEQQEMEQILWEKGKSALNMVRQDVTRSLAAGDTQALENEIRPILADSDLDYMFVFDDMGVIASASDPGITPEPREPLPRLNKLRRHFVVRKTNDYMEILTPVFVNGKRVGGVGLGVSLDLTVRQGRRIGRRLLAVTAGLLAGALAFMYWWTRQTVKPLVELTRGARRISAGD